MQTSILSFILLQAVSKSHPEDAGTSAITTVLPIVISSLAFIFSIISLFFNYYIQYRKKAEIVITISDKLKSFIGDTRLNCNMTITIFNQGAQYGAVYKMTAELFNKQTNTLTTLNWDMFMQDKNVGVVGERFKTHTAFESYAETIVIQGRTAITKKIQFISPNNFQLQLGDYDLEIFVFSGTEKKHSFSTLKKFTVTQNDLGKWQEVSNNYDSENRISRSAITFILKD